MPFRFDRTPLGAVESLARRAGQVQAENTAFSQNLALRQLSNQEQNQAYARESDAQDRTQRNNAFQLQLASAARDEERIKISQSKADQATLTEQGRYNTQQRRLDQYEAAQAETARKNQANESAKLKLDESLIESRESEQLDEAQLKVGAASAKLKEAGVYFDTATKNWYKKDWVFDNKITDSAEIEGYSNLARIMASGTERAASLQTRIHLRQALSNPNSDLSVFNRDYALLNAAEKANVDEMIRTRGMPWVLETTLDSRIKAREDAKQAGIAAAKKPDVSGYDMKFLVGGG